MSGLIETVGLIEPLMAVGTNSCLTGQAEKLSNFVELVGRVGLERIPLHLVGQVEEGFGVCITEFEERHAPALENSSLFGLHIKEVRDHLAHFVLCGSLQDRIPLVVAELIGPALGIEQNTSVISRPEAVIKAERSLCVPVQVSCPNKRPTETLNDAALESRVGFGRVD